MTIFKRNKSNDGLPGASANQTVQSSNTDAILRELAIDYMRDKKIRRWWKIALFVLAAIYMVGLIMMSAKFSEGGALSTKSHVAVVELNGIIGTERGVSANRINRGLQAAFKANLAKGVILKINSPGGSPVQSAEINTEIIRLKKQYPDKPFYVVMSDVAASGGYFVAAAADKIYANRSSIVGSIGVRMDGFGFVDALKKYGVERRSLTAGKNKAILDPFLPVKPEQKAHAEKMLNQVHQHFIEVVKAGRGERLSNHQDLFTGLFWSGEEAKRLGLIDEFGNVDSVARDVIGEAEVVDYSYRPDFWEEFSRNMGASIGAVIANSLQSNMQLQ